MKNSIFLLLTLCFLCQCSCKKSILANDDDDNPPMTELEKLPPITSEGANTFGCLINGEAWVAHNPSILVGGGDFEVDVRYDEPYSFLQVRANLINDERDEYFVFSVPNVPETGEYEIPFREEVYTDFEGCGFYRLDSLYQKILKINHLDIPNKSISSEFEFTLIGQGLCLDTLVVTEGRFDAKYRE